jgi:hypothetical protein
MTPGHKLVSENMGSGGRVLDSICIRMTGFCCILRDRQTHPNEQKLLMDLVEAGDHLGH